MYYNTCKEQITKIQKGEKKMTRKEQFATLERLATKANKQWEEVILYNNKEEHKLFKQWVRKAEIDEFDDMAYLIRLESKALKNGFTKDRKEW